MRGITKRFGAIVANDHVHFELAPQEIHALLGENGAGKTTLMRILYGLYSPDDGEIIINGSPIEIHSPHDAIEAGIGMVSQHFTLVPTLTVAENVVMGHTDGFQLDPKAMENKVAAAAERFGIEVKPSTLVRHLSVGEQQRVEILKALYRDARILILDEPTAVLVPQEVDLLFETLKRLVEDGLSIVFISHKLYEVMAICNRITVLRNGQRVGTVPKEETTKVKLARMMVGRETFGVKRTEEGSRGEPVLTVKDLNVENEQGLRALKEISLEVHAGEILGIAGVSGNGQSELTDVLTGMIEPTSGQIKLGDRDLTGADPNTITDAGVGRIPEDRHKGVVGDLTVAENLALEHLSDFVSGTSLDRNAIRANAEKLIEEYSIKALPTDRIRTLSGGNMQKVILARALSKQPAVVIAAQPTRGLDVGATEYVRTKLLEQRRRGAGVLLLSEDLDEVLALSDRIAVIYEGEIVGVVEADQADVDQLGLMMSGAKEADIE
ncbi:MAG: ABC transporter ATP-binding protein [Anaerolineales bacterium]